MCVKWHGDWRVRNTDFFAYKTVRWYNKAENIFQSEYEPDRRVEQPKVNLKDKQAYERLAGESSGWEAGGLLHYQIGETLDASGFGIFMYEHLIDARLDMPILKMRVPAGTEFRRGETIWTVAPFNSINARKIEVVGRAFQLNQCTKD